MELWQWVVLEKGELETWVAQAEHPLGGLGKVQLGAPAFSSGMVYPFVLGVAEAELGGLDAPALEGPWALVFEFAPALEGSRLKTMTILSEMSAALAEAVGAAGFAMVSFRSLAQGQMELVLDVSGCGALGEQVRGVTLARASLETLACVRGFEIRHLRLRHSVSGREAPIESPLAHGLKTLVG